MRPDQKMTQDFLGISACELEAIRNRIRKVGGHVRIAVHPLFIHYHPGNYQHFDSTCTPAEAHAYLSAGFERMVRSVISNPNSVPLLIFEEPYFLAETKDVVSRISGESSKSLAEQGFLFYTTKPFSGELNHEKASECVERAYQVPAELTLAAITRRQAVLSETLETMYDRYRPPPGKIAKDLTDDEWRQFMIDDDTTGAYHAECCRLGDIIRVRANTVLVASCETLGIGSALVSGAYFVFHKDLTGNWTADGCANRVTQALRTVGIAVDISRYVALRREVLQKHGYATRQTGSFTMRAAA